MPAGRPGYPKQIPVVNYICTSMFVFTKLQGCSHFSSLNYKLVVDLLTALDFQA